MKNYVLTPAERRGSLSFKWDLLSKEFGREDIIPLTVADIDFKIHKEIAKTLKKLIKIGVPGYTFIPDEYFSLIANWIRENYALDISEKNILFCSRIVQALSILINNLTSKNDKIALFTPSYSPLRNVIILNDRTPIDIPLVYDEALLEYKIDFEKLSFSLDGVKIFILINPHNPTGKVFKREELLKLAKILNSKNILIFSDEIYADFVFGGNKFVSMGTLGEEFWNNLIIAHSYSKSFNLCGLQFSHLIIKNEVLIDKFNLWIKAAGVHEPNFFTPYAVITGLKFGKSYIKSLLNIIQKNYNYLNSIFTKSLRDLKITKLEGGYLLWIDYKKTGLSREKFLNWLINSAKVGVQMGESFGEGGENFFRINIACPTRTFKKAVKRLVNSYPLK